MSKRLANKVEVENKEYVDALKEAEEDFAIAKAIIKARSKAGLSQLALAKKLNTTQSVIARLESGNHSPSVSTLKRLAKATHTKLKIELI